METKLIVEEGNIMTNKQTATLYYLASALFYVKAILNLTDSGFTTGIVWFCLGSACLCLAGAAKNGKNGSDEKNQDHSDKKID